MRRSDVKGKLMLECFSWTAASVVMFAAGIQIAFLSPLTVLAAPVPFLLFTCRAGIKASMPGALAGTFFVFFTMGEVSAFMYLCEFALLGLLAGFIMLRVKSGADYFLAAVAASVAVKLFLIGAFNYAAGFNPFMITPEAAESFISSVSGTLSHGGVSVSPESVKSYALNMVNTVSLLMPSMLILFAACDTAAGYLAARLYAKRDGSFSVPELPPFASWRFPKNIFWALLAALILDMASKAMPDDPLYKMLSMNMMEVLRGVFLIEGLSLAWYFMTAYRVNRAVRCLAVCFGLFFAPVSYVLSMVGVFDIWYDLRKRIKLRGK